MKLKLPFFVREILKKFQENNYEIYIVGGAVRDILMKKKVNDWDFTTNATPPEILSLFPEGFYNNQFGTVGIAAPNASGDKSYYGKPAVYEITTFRKEVGYTDRRHPDKIIWGENLGEDLLRRDFTINAIALKPISKLISGDSSPLNFKIIDPFGGQKDIKNKLIRAVGDPDQRFKEDALRIMRAIRIATQLRFNIEEKTFLALRENINLLDHISKERIRDELFKLFSYPYADQGIKLLRNAGILQKILPEVEKMFGVEQKSPQRHHQDDVGTHALKSLKASRSKNPLVNLAILLHDVGKPLVFKKDKNGVITFYNHEVIGASIALNIAKRLKFSKMEQRKLWTLVRWHQFSVDERQTDKAIRRFIRRVGKENLKDILELRRADRIGGGAKETSWRLEKFKQKLTEVQKQPFTVQDLKVSGYDVMKVLNLKPGPKVGEILNNLLEKVVDGKLKNQRETLLKEISEMVSE